MNLNERAKKASDNFYKKRKESFKKEIKRLNKEFEETKNEYIKELEQEILKEANSGKRSLKKHFSTKYIRDELEKYLNEQSISTFIPEIGSIGPSKTMMEIYW